LRIITLLAPCFLPTVLAALSYPSANAGTQPVLNNVLNNINMMLVAAFGVTDEPFLPTVISIRLRIRRPWTKTGDEQPWLIIRNPCGQRTKKKKTHTLSGCNRCKQLQQNSNRRSLRPGRSPVAGRRRRWSLEEREKTAMATYLLAYLPAFRILK
jgi:hypothetical protein